jgi:predicted transposase YbfD/YdcC
MVYNEKKGESAMAKRPEQHATIGRLFNILPPDFANLGGSDASVLRDLRNHIKANVKDPRFVGQIRFYFHELLMIVMLAAMSGCTSYVQMALFAREKEAWLRTFLDLPIGVPGKNALWNAMKVVDESKWHAAVAGFFMERIEAGLSAFASDADQDMDQEVNREMDPNSNLETNHNTEQAEVSEKIDEAGAEGKIADQTADQTADADADAETSCCAAAPIRKYRTRYFDARFNTITRIDDIIDGYACDGKALNGSDRVASNVDPGQPKIFVMNKYSIALGMVLRSVVIPAKTNEITTFGELLDGDDLRGIVVTADALNAHPGIAREIAEKGGSYCLGLKKNNRILFGDIVEVFKEEACGTRFETTEEIDGWTIQREYRFILDPDQLKDFYKIDQWANATAIGAVRTTRIKTSTGESSTGIRYYIVGGITDIEAIAYAISKHWQVENCLHWNLDCVMECDPCRATLGGTGKALYAARTMALMFLELGRRVLSKYKTDVKKMFLMDCRYIQLALSPLNVAALS